MSMPEAAGPTRISGRSYILGVLTLVYTFNHIDRQILVILLEPIKAELGLSDGSLGILTGIAFALFYATLGIPIAIWADRGNRRNIITIALTIWSGMTALSGFAQNFWQLAVARMGVGFGEAGCTPSATSMISDLYPPKERATALGIYTMGIGLGVMAGFALGGFIYELYGWRVAFFIAGVPGLLLALLVKLTVREPLRGASEAVPDTSPAPSISETLGFIFSQRAFVWMLTGSTLLCISSNASLVFIGSYLIRTFGLEPGNVGLPLGLLIGGVGSLGAFAIGILCDRLSRNDLRWRPWLVAITSALALPFAYMFLRASTANMAYAWYIIPSFIGLVYASIIYTASQELVQLRMRAFASAFTILCLTLIGIGGGPWLAGVLSDYFTSQDAANPLRSALTLILSLNMASIFCLLIAAHYYRADVERASISHSSSQSQD